MVRRTKEEAQETRSGILDAAELVFFEKEFHAHLCPTSRTRPA